MPNHILINSKINSYKKKIEVNSDKSLSIRCVLLSSIALGISKISNLLESEDVLNSLKAIKKLGIDYKKRKNIFEIKGRGLSGYNPKKNTIINAGNSGTLARCLIGICARIKNQIKIVGDKSLSKRDFSRVTEPLKNFGFKIKSKKGFLPVKIQGSNFLRPIKFIENKGSAQVKTSLIFCGLNTPGTTVIKAKKSRNHTELLLKNLKLPIKVKSKGNYDNIEIKGLNQFKAFNYDVPGDISSASFFIVLTLLSKKSELLIKKVNVNKSRLGIVKILNMMNAKIKLQNKRLYKGEEIADIFVKSNNNFKSINCPPSLNSSAIDELLLIICLISARAKGVSTFRELGELNKKESKRLDLAIKFLKMIGIKTERKKDNIKVFGNPELNLNGKYDVKHFLKDHRIFMMSTIAALTLGGRWKINDKSSIKTSFPKFLNILTKLGAKIN